MRPLADRLAPAELRSGRAAALAALALAAAAAFAVAALQRPGRAPVRLAGAPIAVQKTLSPREPEFGDPVTASVDVLLDPGRVDLRSVRVESSFAPYRVVSTARTDRRVGGVAIVHVEQRLACLDVSCLPPAGGGALRPGALRVAYVAVDGRPRELRSAWPALRVLSRVTAADLRRPFLRVPPAHASAVDYRLPPRATGYALIAVAALLALGGAAAILRVALRAGLLPRGRAVPVLERILRELEASSANGDSSRRRLALEHLARELEPVDPALSAESRVLAWAPEDPRPEAIAELTGRVLTAVGR